MAEAQRAEILFWRTPPLSEGLDPSLLLNEIPAP